jgi:hypothetical protein
MGTMGSATAVSPTAPRVASNNVRAATSREDILVLIGEEHYDDNRTAAQNLVRYLVDGGTLPLDRVIIFTRLHFSFEGENGNRIDFSSNVLINGCRLTSPGHISFFHGHSVAQEEGARLEACGSDAIGVALGEGADVIAKHPDAKLFAFKGGRVHPFELREEGPPVDVYGFQEPAMTAISNVEVQEGGSTGIQIRYDRAGQLPDQQWQGVTRQEAIEKVSGMLHEVEQLFPEFSPKSFPASRRGNALAQLLSFRQSMSIDK